MEENLNPQPFIKEQLPPPRKIFKPRVLLLSLLAIVVAVLGFYFWQKISSGLEKKIYTETYRLTPEKISQSAAIRIYLPPKVDKEFAKSNVKFSPEIEGQWAEESGGFWTVLAQSSDPVPSSEEDNVIYFRTKDKLALNHYYLAELTTPDGGIIKSDFLAVEDPEIVAIFPKAGSETPENSEITIVFNRPMVPLTSLGYLDTENVPVQISPKTEGKFKWTSTRNLQFIPEERLVRSSHYTVKIKSGFISADGLQVKGTETEFITRQLRYLSMSQGETVYNQPISIYFNQPVDLDRTIKDISLLDSNGQKIPFTAEYGKKESSGGLGDQAEDNSFGLFSGKNSILASVFNQFGFKLFPSKETPKETDKSIIQIYNQKDRFGREKFWDFNTSYNLQINKAYPLEGDIILDSAMQAGISVSSVIKNITAESQRTQYASKDFFDPQGKLWIEFYEEIDLGKSKISAPKVKETGYGEKCIDENLSLNSCEKTTDKKKVYITFRSDEIGLGESFEVNFDRIVNVDGLTANKEPIKETVSTYPKFEILSTFPANNSSQSSLTDFIFCSNSPILSPAAEDYKKYITANFDYEVNYWGKSWKVEYASPYEKCGPNEFHTQIGYGLMPQSDYSLNFNLEDVFGQKLDYSSNIATGQIPSESLYLYRFQNDYNVTSLSKTRLTFGAKNMEYVNMEICKLAPINFLYYLENMPDWSVSSAGIPCQQIARDVIELPKRYWITNRFDVDIKNYFPDPTGHYILTLSHPDYNQYYWTSGGRTYSKVYERSYLTVTNLAVAEKIIQPQTAYYGSSQPLDADQMKELRNLYWVTNLSNLDPVNGAKVNLYRGENLSFSGSYQTNDQGVALTDIVSDLKGAIIVNGNDSTVIPSWESKLNWASYAYSAKNIYLYTDKPIYQPTQEVFIKGIYRVGYDGNYEIYQGKKINMVVYNSKNDEILNQNLDVNDFGTFNAKLTLENAAPLGMYRFCVEQYTCSYFDVQEYVQAPFEVNVKSDKEEYVSKDTVNLDLEANYYFGVPLEGGEVSYTVSSQDYYFDRYSDGYFNFGASWYYWPSSYGDKFILRGKTSLSEEGKARISQELDLEKLFKNKDDRKSKIIVVDVTVVNSQGQSVSSQKSFILHAGQFYLGQSSDKSFLGKNEKFNLKTKSVDTQGKETKVGDITMSLYKVDWIYSKRQEATGGYSYTWEKKRDLVKEYKFNTDGKGNHTQELSIGEEGEYETEVSAKDRNGNIVWSVYNIYVYGGGQVTVKPTKDTQLEIEAERNNLNVGDQGNVIIKSPYAKAKALISIERGRIFEYQIKEISGNLYNYSFNINEDYVPNVYVSVLLQSSEPEVKFGQVEFNVNTKQKELNIEVKSNKNSYLPGEEVVLDVSAKDYQNKPVSAELSLSVVDLSVLALKGNPKKNPIVFFYGGFPLTIQTSSNIKNILIETDIPTKGGGGGSDESLAKKARGVFKETAFWQATVRTDGEGKAQIKFTLPDNLTTWQTEALGITKDTKVGVAYQEFMTRKDLMITPLKPRFSVPGDIFYIGAKIFNQTEEKQIITVKFESGSLTLEEKSSQKKVAIGAEKTSTVYFKVKAPTSIETGEHQFSLSAKSKSSDLEDTVIQYIKITPSNTYEVVATANYTTDKVSKEYVFLPDNVVKDKGELSVKSSATLAVFLSDSLNYLLQYPYGCAEQIASQLKAISVVKKGLSLPNLGDKLQLDKIENEGKEYTIDEVVDIGLNQIYNKQNWDGGFSYWQLGQSNFHLTLHVIEALQNLSLAGYNIDQQSLNKAASYIYTQITTNKDLYKNENNIILAAYTLSNLPQFTDTNYILRQKIVNLANNDTFINDKISNSSLAYLAILLDKGGFDSGLKKKVNDTLDNRIDIDSRGAFLEMNENSMWDYYETAIKNTALYLKSLAQSRSQNPIMDKVLRWILNSRGKDGAWGSTNNTITVIDALTDFLQWKRETESEFTLDLSVNNKSEGSFDFNPKTILDQLSKVIPLKDLKFNSNNTIQFDKADKNNLQNSLYYDLSLKYFVPADQVAPRDEGFSITRGFYSPDDKENKTPLLTAKVGDVLRVHLQITVPKTRNFAVVEDYIPAGMEIVNLSLATEQKSLLLQEKEILGREFIPDFEEMHNDRAFLYKERLEPGVYEFDYYVRALIEGKFIHLPAVVSEMYFPDNFGRTSGDYFEIK